MKEIMQAEIKRIARKRNRHEGWIRDGHLKIEQLRGPMRSEVRACKSELDKELCQVAHDCQKCKWGAGNDESC